MDPLRANEGQQGAIAVVVAAFMGVLVPVAALVIDIGSAAVAKHRLRNLADAAALAGSRQLGWSAESGSLTSAANQAHLQAVAQGIATKNRIGSQPVMVQVLVGAWDATAHTFSGGALYPNAVAVSGETAVPTFLGGMVGVNTITVSARSTAALTPLGQLAAGALSLPMGIARAWFADTGWQNKRFTVTSGSKSGKDKDRDREKGDDKGTNKGNQNGRDQGGTCIGWTTFTASPASTGQVQGILQQLRAGTFKSPVAEAGQSTFQFTGDDIGDAFADLQSLYDARKNPKTGQWSTVVPVYNKHDCQAPKGSLAIVGFATVVIAQQKDALTGVVSKHAVQRGRGGGPDFGTLGSLPSLVN